jgi:hypothetical protein
MWPLERRLASGLLGQSEDCAAHASAMTDASFVLTSDRAAIDGRGARGVAVTMGLFILNGLRRDDGEGTH